MKKIAAIFALATGAVFSSAHAVILVGWDLPGSTANTNVAASTAATGVVGGNMYKDTGLSVDTASTTRWQFSSYNQTNTDTAAMAAALAGNDSVSFSLTASTGYSVTVRGIGPASFYRSGGGPRYQALLYSTNLSFSTYSVVATSTMGVAGTSITTDYSTNAAWTSFVTPITVAEGTTGYFRFVGYGSTGTGGTGGFVASGTVDFSLVGDVNSLGIYTWTGGSGAWASGDAANWQAGGAPAAWINGRDVAFASGGNLAVDAGGVSAGAINLSGTTPVTLTGGTITASSIVGLSGSVLNINGASPTVSGNVDLTDASIADGGLNFGGIFGANISTGAKTISTALGGNGSLSKLGAGELILSAASTHSGGTSVGVGTLTTGANEVLSDTATLQVSSGATFKLGGNETVGALNAVYGSFIDLQNYTLTSGANGLSFTNGATITGTGGLVKNGTGQMYLNNSANTFSGGFTLNEGSVAFTSSGGAASGVITNTVFGTGPLTLNGGTVTSSSANSGRNVYNNIFLNGDLQFGTTSWGTTNVTMNTSVSVDTSKTSNNVTFPQSAVITVSTNGNGVATLQKNVTISTIAYVDWYQPISGNYRITKSGVGDYALSNNFLQLRASNNIAGMTVNSGFVSYKNRYAFGSGTLVLKDGVGIGQDGTINNTPLTGDDQIDRAIPNDISIEGNVGFGTGSTANHLGGNINLNGGNRTITVINTSYLYGSVSNGALTVFDTAPSRTLHLLASNSYAGGTTHDGGILSVGNDNALGSGGLTVLSNKSYTNVSTNIYATVTTNGSTKTTNYVSTNYVTNVTVASNRLTMNTNSLSRTLTNGIALASGALYNIEIPQILTTTNDPGTGLAITNTNTYSMLHNGPISGAGSILKSGGGTLTLAGALSYSGSTTVTGGELRVEKTNLTTSITPANVTFIFSNNATTGTNQALPGALGGSYLASNITYSNLPSSLGASFDANAGTVVVTNAAAPAPANLSYGSTELSATYGALMTTVTPTCDNSPTSYSITPELPGGLIFNTVNGSIGGTPTTASARSPYTVTASNGGGSTPRTIYLTVNPASLPSVTFTPPGSLTYDGTAKTHTASATGPSGLTLTYTGRDGTTYNSSTAPKNVGLYTVTATSADANYTGSQATNFSITAKGLTITGATATSRAYNASTNVVVSGGTLVGIQSGDTVTLDSSGAAGTVATAAVGTGKAVTVTGYSISGTDSGNYSLSQPTGVTVDITAKGLTITGATATSRPFNGTTSVVVSGGTLVGLEGGDSVTLGGSPAGTVATAAVGTGKAVTVTGYSISGTDSGNYSLSQPTGVTVDITSAGQTISDWLGGAATNAANVGKYLIGGGTNVDAASERPVIINTNATNLILSAIVRTNDTKGSVVGQWVTNVSGFSSLADGSNEVAGTRSANQSGVDATQCERREFSVPRTNGTNRLFLRLKATLAP